MVYYTFQDLMIFRYVYTGIADVQFFRTESKSHIAKNRLCNLPDSEAAFSVNSTGNPPLRAGCHFSIFNISHSY